MSTLNETIKDIDHKKKQLQESVDQLNEHMEVLKMEGEVLVAFSLSLVKNTYVTMQDDVFILTCPSLVAGDIQSLSRTEGAVVM